jgi:GNAT superfamily N-acetyltransferase
LGAAPSPIVGDEIEAWFALGGPWHHPHTCERHLQSYAAAGGEIWLAVTAGDRLVGSLEIWFDDEPEPFGRYGHVELLELRPEYQSREVETWLIDWAEARARQRGYQRFWCRPVGSGGSEHVLRQRGYVHLWANAQVTLRNLPSFEPPAHQVTALTGDYSVEAAHLLALNHREAAGFRWRYLWLTALDPNRADWPRSTRLSAQRVQFESGVGGLFLLSLWPWYADPAEARVDLWIRPEQSANVALVGWLLAVAAALAASLGAASLISCLPKPLAQALASSSVEASPLEGDDPWFRKLL